MRTEKGKGARFISLLDMERKKLIEALKELQDHDDPEVAHAQADDLLLEYINDPTITRAYMNAIR